jgi:large subunit ribosomal protein L30
VVETLRFLRLNRKYHLVIVDDRASYRGMLQKAKDYITWGEISAESIAYLLKKRGLLSGGTKLTDVHVTKYTNFNTIDEFAAAIAAFNADFLDINKLKPVFRLHPPTGGFKGKTKRPVRNHGELGYRGAAIEQLIKKMA